jgi:hypothetical protein
MISFTHPPYYLWTQAEYRTEDGFFLPSGGYANYDEWINALYDFPPEKQLSQQLLPNSQKECIS